MNIGDRCAFTAGATTVTVVVDSIRPDGLVLVHNAERGSSAPAFLVRGDSLVPRESAVTHETAVPRDPPTPGRDRDASPLDHVGQ
ncbi:hypothetical protein CH263_20010 [Rhodococcus sp. 06-1059B-a]|nr:hypothetical protein [Rhodococcus sp. 06-1059B-a]OZD60781.1 hypothetical protein CH263_20010 [Rhodococcus sp. 06-1059B-a]